MYSAICTDNKSDKIDIYSYVSVWAKEQCARGKRGCRVVSHHINKEERRLITRTSICQAGRQYVSFLYGGLFVSCDFLQLLVMNTGLCTLD